MAAEKSSKATAKKRSRKGPSKKAASKKTLVDKASSQTVSEPSSGPEQVKTVWIIAGFIILALIVLGTVLLFQRANTYDHNGFIFEKTRCSGDDPCWQTNVVTNVGVHPITFYHGPRDVEDIMVSPDAVRRVLNMTVTGNSSVIVTFDEGVPGEVGVAAAQIARITGDRFYRIPTTGSVYGRPITCADSSKNRVVIHITQGPGNGVLLKDGCVLVIAEDKDDVIRVADAFGLHLLRIM